MKAISKWWQRFGEHIAQAVQRVRAFPSKLGQCLWEHINKFLFIVGSLLVALGVVVMFSDDVVIYLQELLGLNEKSDMLENIVYCVAGVVYIWLAKKRINAMEASTKEQAKATKNTEAKQRQERLNNAIEHLGHDRDSVRIGGAHELFHLAKDTEDLRQTVLNFLCAHIRQATSGGAYQVEHKTKPSEEIQSLLTLLFVQEHAVFEDCSINLQGSYLNGADLSQARLKKADLRQVQLQDADLSKAQLQGVGLSKAQLQGIELFETQLQRADLSEVQLQEADLMMAKLQGANFWGAQMQGAELMNAQMQGAVLWLAQMQGAMLMETQLQGAVLKDARLQGASLMNAKLQGAKLVHAQLQGATLWGAQMQGVSSHEAYPYPSAGFESEIRNRIGDPSDLTGMFFADGLQQKDLDALCEGLSAKKAQALRETLGPHVGEPVSRELPRDSGAETGTYTQEEAEQWIAEYNKAMDEVPGAGDS